jgi:hypothetical protein
MSKTQSIRIGTKTLFKARKAEIFLRRSCNTSTIRQGAHDGALDRWLEILGTADGPVFRKVNRHEQISGKRLTAQSVVLVVKRAAAAAGLEAKDHAGHSLPVSQPPLPPPGSQSTPSRPRPAIVPSPPCASTSAKDQCFWKIVRPRWVGL